MKPGAVRIQAPIYGSSGYASAARSFALALADLQRLPVYIEPLTWVSGFDIQESQALYLKLSQLEQPQGSLGQNLLLHWSLASEFQGRQGDALAVGHCIFETNSLIQSFVTGCNRMDAVIVPSEFHRQAFAAAGVRVPMVIVPEGVDAQRFCPQGPRLTKIPQRFTFLFVSQLSYRKGFDLALKAFLELFADHEDVQLILRCYIKDGSAQDLKQVADFIRIFRENEMNGLKKGHVFLLENVPDLHLPALYRSAHVLLAPFRGEGWGLPMMEALASETPVIATAWGGPMAYLKPEFASLLAYQLHPIPQQVPDLFLGKHLIEARAEGHLLAEPDYQQLKYAMWDAYQHYARHKTQAAQARTWLQRSFRWEQAAQQFLDWVEQI